MASLLSHIIHKHFQGEEGEFKLRMKDDEILLEKSPMKIRSGCILGKRSKSYPPSDCMWLPLVTGFSCTHCPRPWSPLESWWWWFTEGVQKRRQDIHSCSNTKVSMLISWLMETPQTMLWSFEGLSIEMWTKNMCINMILYRLPLSSWSLENCEDDLLKGNNYS